MILKCLATKYILCSGLGIESMLSLLFRSYLKAVWISSGLVLEYNNRFLGGRLMGLKQLVLAFSIADDFISEGAFY